MCCIPFSWMRWGGPSVIRTRTAAKEAAKGPLVPSTPRGGLFQQPGRLPSVCILDPDGDLVRRLRQTGAAKPFEGCPCYHTELDTFELGGHRVGIVGRVVGASFAVLIAEELFASGCQLLVSLTSAGQIKPPGPPSYFVVIDGALRDEGKSYHYARPLSLLKLILTW
jgi:hypothetical protein